MIITWYLSRRRRHVVQHIIHCTLEVSSPHICVHKTQDTWKHTREYQASICICPSICNPDIDTALIRYATFVSTWILPSNNQLNWVEKLLDDFLILIAKASLSIGIQDANVGYLRHTAIPQ